MQCVDTNTCSMCMYIGPSLHHFPLSPPSLVDPSHLTLMSNFDVMSQQVMPPCSACCYDAIHLCIRCFMYMYRLHTYGPMSHIDLCMYVVVSCYMFHSPHSLQPSSIVVSFRFVSFHRSVSCCFGLFSFPHPFIFNHIHLDIIDIITLSATSTLPFSHSLLVLCCLGEGWLTDWRNSKQWRVLPAPHGCV